MAVNQFRIDISNVPNKISVFRIALIFICVIFFACGFPIIGSSLGLIAGLSDYADGIYARKHNMCTRLGALLDQVADLLFNFLVISVAAYMGVWPIWILWAWGLRDLGVLSMRASAAQLGFDIPSIYLGKLASAVIYYSLFLMPITFALTSHDTAHFYLYPQTHPVYQFAPWVAENIPWWVGFGLYWIAFAGVVVGIILQWITAVKYMKTYVHKYNEIHEAEQKAAENAQTQTSKTPDKENVSNDSAKAEQDAATA
ncbi:MAG: CDP-alcohol phosphatidyltransferase family protein [Proteobacteria bacterium]|nr:CDP-alcohol phosphatidyltransferase family protein [Pseudomonadota bacterium]